MARENLDSIISDSFMQNCSVYVMRYPYDKVDDMTLTKANLDG